jgi:hypothetical protein
MPVGDDDLGEWWIQQRGHIDQASKPLFDFLLLLIAWKVWKDRTCRVFRRIPSSTQDVVRAAVQEGEDWALARFTIGSPSSCLVTKLSRYVTNKH